MEFAVKFGFLPIGSRTGAQTVEVRELIAFIAERAAVGGMEISRRTIAFDAARTLWRISHDRQETNRTPGCDVHTANGSGYALWNLFPLFGGKRQTLLPTLPKVVGRVQRDSRTRHLPDMESQMSGQSTKMKARINEARKKAGEKPVKYHCCRSGWSDIHTRACPKHPDNKGKK